MRAVLLLLCLLGRPALAADELRSGTSTLDVIVSSVGLERVALPQAVASVHVEALRRRIVLELDHRHSVKDAQKKWSGLVKLCPEADQTPTAIILHCATGRVEATLLERKRQPYLEIRELRGLPWREADDALPLLTYDPPTADLGEGCPGTTSAGRGECLLIAGDRSGAGRSFLEAAHGTPEMPFAGIRLGDLALRQTGVGDALRWYRSVPPGESLGRLAAARICGLTGSCLGGPTEASTFDAAEVREPFREELQLQRIRMLALTDRMGDAVQMLLTEATPAKRLPICDRAMTFCRTLTLAALESLPDKDRGLALQIYMILPDRSKGPLAADMAEAAAQAAERAGAPRFGANILASATSTVPPERLDPYLRETARLFLAGDDRAHADVIFEFAREHLSPAVLRHPEWKALLHPAAPAPAGAAKSALVVPPTVSAADLAHDTDRASAAIAAARARIAGAAP